MGSSRLSFSHWTAALLMTAALAGCTSSPSDSYEAGRPPALIPPRAQRVAEGPPPLSYLAAPSSTVYILDDDTRALMNTSEIPANGSGLLVVDPTEKSIMIKLNGDASSRIVLAAPIDISHRYSIWVTKNVATTQP